MLSGHEPVKLPQHKFGTIVEFAKRRITAGSWRAGERVPSENELAAQFKVSRMTARRALDQLALDGLVIRRRGSGSFIASNGVRSSFMVVRNIADEIAESGRSYSSRVLKQVATAATRRVAEELELEIGDEVFHSVIVHLADGRPVQLEDRYVRPGSAPGYLQANLSLETPNHYLQRICPLTHARQEVTAGAATVKQCEVLEIRHGEPCLVITRVTTAHVGLVSYARILAPASRYKLSGQLHFSSKIEG